MRPIVLCAVLLVCGVAAQNDLFGKYTYAEDDFEHAALGLMKELSSIHNKINAPRFQRDEEAELLSNLDNTARAMNAHLRHVKRYDDNGKKRSKYDIEIKIVPDEKIKKEAPFAALNKDGSMSSAFLAAQTTRAKLKDFLRQFEIEPAITISDDNSEKKHHIADLATVAVPDDYASHVLKIDPLPLQKSVKLTDPLDADDAEVIKDQHGNKIQVIPGTDATPVKPAAVATDDDGVVTDKYETVKVKIIEDKNEDSDDLPDENVSEKKEEKEEKKEKKEEKEEKKETTTEDETEDKTEEKTEEKEEEKTEEKEEKEEEKTEEKAEEKTEEKAEDTTAAAEEETDDTKAEEKKETKTTETATEEADPEPTD